MNRRKTVKVSSTESMLTATLRLARRSHTGAEGSSPAVVRMSGGALGKRGRTGIQEGRGYAEDHGVLGSVGLAATYKGEFPGAGPAFNLSFAFPGRLMVGVSFAVHQLNRTSCFGVLAADSVVVFGKASRRIQRYSSVQ
jgi:hypothetical protein